MRIARQPIVLPPAAASPMTREAQSRSARSRPFSAEPWFAGGEDLRLRFVFEMMAAKSSWQDVHCKHNMSVGEEAEFE